MAKKGPLKKVMREFVVERKRYLAMPAYDRYEELECGHVIRQPKDLYGGYYAERRRCTQCAAQQTVSAFTPIDDKTECPKKPHDVMADMGLFNCIICRKDL